MSNNKDLLDLCRLNLMEETIVDSPAPDRDDTLKAIDYKKRQLMGKIPKLQASQKALDTHIERNQPDDFLISIIDQDQQEPKDE